MFTNLIEKDAQDFVEKDQLPKRKGTNKRKTLEELNSYLVGTGFECVDNNLDTPRTFPSAYGMYKFPCGHLQETKHDRVRAGKVRCQVCFVTKKEQEANSHGIAYLGEDPLGRANYRLYKLQCGHESSLVMSHVSRGIFSPSCSDCISAKHEEEAAKNGLILIDYFDTSKRGYKEYTYKACGHSKYMSLFWVAKGQIPPCDICTRLRWEEEAKDFSIEMLNLPPENIDGVNYFNYRLGCGCIKQATTSDVRRKSVGCSVHSSYWNKTATIYFVKFGIFGKEWLKVGVSSNESRRFNEYFRGQNYTIDKILSLNFCSLHAATIFEKSIHKQFKKDKISKEALRPLMKSGFDECYPIEMLENIKGVIVENYQQYKKRDLNVNHC